jgi:hypothetical protein
MPFPEDWRAFIESLNSNGVEYLIVGAVALAHHGFPRNTPENTRRVEAALVTFGFAGLGLKAQDFSEPYRIIQLGVPPNRIDLLTSITGLSFEEAWADRAEAELEGLKVSFLGRQSLIRNKKLTGRTQDKADIEALEESKE